MIKILVTGGCGFIGSHIVEALHQKNEVIVFDNLKSGFQKNIEPFNVKFVEGDVRNAELLRISLKDVNTIYHLAALISVPESMEKPVETVEINTIGTLNVLEAARINGVRNIVLSSSAANYGDNPVVPKIETMLPEPKSPYAITKLDGEYYFNMYRNEFGINAVSLRYFNAFGPRQDPNSQYAAAIPIFVAKALQNQDIIIFGDGEQTRDFIFVKDVVQANLLAAEKGGDLFNVAYGKKITINQLADKIIRITGSCSKINHGPVRPGDVKHSMADNSKITRQLGFKQAYDFDKALETTIEYFAERFK
ncbi:SDR family oxidoreductase [candidate division KSB1 bacterium]|nr:SDR family oxidoreductase [candidate division KSB1 bacterium]